MAQVTFDTVELENFVKRLGTAAQGDFKRALNKFLEGLGIEFLRILQDEIVRRNVLDYRLLLHSFQKGDGENVWTPGRKDRDGPKNEMGGGLPLLGKLRQNPRKALPGAARKEAAELAGRVFQGFFVR